MIVGASGCRAAREFAELGSQGRRETLLSLGWSWLTGSLGPTTTEQGGQEAARMTSPPPALTSWALEVVGFSLHLSLQPPASSPATSDFVPHPGRLALLPQHTRWAFIAREHELSGF